MSDPLGLLKGWYPNASSACGWAGVLCSSLNHVIALNLRDGELVGNIGSILLALGPLRFLQRLDLSVNEFHGSLSGNAFANLSSLETLNISYNQVGGPIPSEIGELRSLSSLSLTANNITGVIPSSLGNCSNLTYLSLYSNFLNGRIPDIFQGTPRLQYLNLGNPIPDVVFSKPLSSGNSLSGSLPRSLGNCSSLQHLILQGNLNLEGEAPFELSLLTELQILLLAACSFTGVLSSWLGNATSFVGFDVSYNFLTGSLPDEVGRLSNLSGIGVRDNFFTGALPMSLTNCTRLKVISASGNKFSGEISDLSFDKLVNLNQLVLGDNLFTGVYPPSIANCSSLEILALGPNPFDPQTIPKWIDSFPELTYLELQNSSLYGDIPREIGKLQNLQFLNLQFNRLAGIFPQWLANCTELNSIIVNENQLRGIIPPDLGNLPLLSTLVIDDNFLSGSIPDSLTNCSQLTIMTVNSNLLSGSLGVVDWGKFSHLRYLALGPNTNFSGSIPSSLGNCSNLIYLNMVSSNLTGHIPTPLSNLSHMALQLLYLQSNNLSGKIPSELFQSSTLIDLRLSENNFEGNVPSEVGECTSLQYFYLSQNRITGEIPDTLGNCSQLLELSLSHNELSGILPSGLFSKIVQLKTLDLSHNNLSGPWPQDLGSLQNIQAIQLSRNNIFGSILLPQTNANGPQTWNALVSLDVSINKLDGLIPATLGLLSNLTSLNISFNNFQGPIPTTGIFQHNVSRSTFLGNPGLCGGILGPGRECPAQAPQASTSFHEEKCMGVTCKRVWIVLACVGSGILLAVLSFFSILGLSWLKHMRGGHRIVQILPYKGRWPFMTISEAEVESIVRGGEENIIGRGAYSVVYKGSRLDGKPLAIKVLNLDNNQEKSSPEQEQQHFKEVHTLAQLRHRNILKVLGFCSGVNVKAIILEYMPKGSLHKHLYTSGVDSCQLSFQTRSEMALGIAEGMKYLHHDLTQSLIHGDLKPTNILLDENMIPKIADFGISRFVPEERQGQHVSASRIIGTVGYIPPEYAFEGRISTRGDVYAYGVLLLELLTGRPPIENSAMEVQPIPARQDSGGAAKHPGTDESGSSEGYRTRILTLYEENSSQMLDSKLHEESAEDSRKWEKIKLMLLLGLLCTRERPQSRPTMADVVAILAQINGLGADVMVARRTIHDLVKEAPSDQDLFTDTSKNSSSLSPEAHS